MIVLSTEVNAASPEKCTHATNYALNSVQLEGVTPLKFSPRNEKATLDN